MNVQKGGCLAPAASRTAIRVASLKHRRLVSGTLCGSYAVLITKVSPGRIAPSNAPWVVRASSDKGEPWPGLAHWLRDAPAEAIEDALHKWRDSYIEFWGERTDSSPQPDQKDRPSFLRHATGLHLVQEVEKYGELVQSVYDTLQTKDFTSPFFGDCAPGVLQCGKQLKEYAFKPNSNHPDKQRLTLSNAAGEYTVVDKLKADSGAYKLVVKEGRNYVGYIATGPKDDQERVDVAIVFRGTITKDDWVQDAKALQVRWEQGYQKFAPPGMRLTSPPFTLSFQSGIATFLGALLVMYFLEVQLSTALKAAGIILAVTAVVKGILVKPQDWPRNVLTLLRASWEWAKYGTCTTWMSIFGQGALVSFGFKEMYCDAQEGTASAKDLPLSPRRSVYRVLGQLLDNHVKIKSITVTGHSLGGALASVCGYDLGTTIEETIQSDSEPKFEPKFKPEENPEYLDELYDATERERKSFMQRIWRLHHHSHENADRPKGDSCPVVAVVSFAAPQVGDTTYARAFKGRSLNDPVAVAQPYTHGRQFSNLGIFLRDHLTQYLKRPVYVCEKQQIVAERQAQNDEKKLKEGKARVHAVVMLRVVNAHDVVPQVPLTLPIQPFSYLHGGHELLLNSYLIPYLKAGKFTGASIPNRHNLEMYLHMLNPTRDRVLVNKSSGALVNEVRIPENWWSPMLNSGLIQDENGKWTRQLP